MLSVLVQQLAREVRFVAEHRHEVLVLREVRQDALEHEHVLLDRRSGGHGHRGGTADTLDSLGFIHLKLGDVAEAKAHYARAVEAYREIGSGAGEGNSLTGFGNALIAAGDPAAAQAAWREAVVISTGVRPVSAMMVDEVLFTVPPWKRVQVELGNAGG